MIFSFVFFFSRDQCRFPQAPFKKLNILPLVIYMVHDYSFFGSTADTNDSTAKIGMNFAYIAINVRNFNSKADFRENATSLNIKHRIY
jgi:hypothetical protein